MKKQETRHRNLAVEPRKWLTPYRTRPRQPRKTVRITRADPYIPQVVVEAARDQTETMTGTPPIKIGTAAQNGGGGGLMDFLSGERAEEDHLRIRTRKMMMGHLGVSEGDEGPGVTQDPGDQKDPGDPQD